MQKDTDVGTVIAVVHGVIELGKFDHNIRKIEDVARRARDEGVEILLLPSMINGGPIFDLKQGIRVKRITDTIPGRTSEYLAKLAHRFGLYIVAGPILERRGSKVYRSVFVVEPTMAVRSVVSQMLTPTGYSHSSSIPIITVRDIDIGVFIAEDIHLPELSLLMRVYGVDTSIFYPYPQISTDKIVAMLKTRALELKVVMMCVGGSVWRKNEEVFLMPTAIVDDNGTLIHETLDKTLKVIKIAIRKNVRRGQLTLDPAYRRLLKLLNRTISSYIRKQD